MPKWKQHQHAQHTCDRRIAKSRRAYLEALNRLVNGTPQTPRLIRMLAEGRSYPINVTTVASEAGRSRNPLYTHHIEVLDLIARARITTDPQRKVESLTPRRRATASSARLEALRAEIARLRKENTAVATQNLGLTVRLDKARKQLERLERDNARLIAKVTK